MTNEEAIKWFEAFQNNLIYEFDVYDERFSDALKASKVAIKALEQQNKYRWHDLRKDPNDLPNDDSIEFIVCVEYRNGKRECTVGCLDIGGDMMLLPTLGNWIGNSYHIIAWREIEPF